MENIQKLIDGRFPFIKEFPRQKLIDVNLLKGVIQECVEQAGEGLFSDVMRKMCDVLDACPPVDAVEVVHGRWIHVDDAEYRCNQCKNHVCFDELLDRSVPEYNYCPNCGAKMDGGNDDGK